MRVKKTENGLKKVNFFGIETARIEFGFFVRPDVIGNSVTYRARIVVKNDELHFTDPTHALIEFTETSKLIFR